VGRTASAAASALLIGTLAAGGALAGSSGPPPSSRGFTVTGSVSGLYPGGRAWLPATVRNPYRRPLRLLSLTAVVRRGRRACSGANLEVRPFRGRLTVPPRRSRVVRLRVRMPLTAAPECNGARFPLVFRGRGVLR
jgi:hypothetical protein